MFQEFIVVLLFLSGAANRAAEVVKSLIHTRFPTANADVVSLVALLTSIVAGIIGALSLNVNVFMFLPVGSYLTDIPPLAGVVITGCLAGFGSEGLHAILDVLYGKRDELVTRAELNLSKAETAELAVEEDAPAAPATWTSLN